MTRKIFLLVFSFTFILAALSSDECYAQRFKKSGSTGRSGNTQGKNLIPHKIKKEITVM